MYSPFSDSRKTCQIFVADSIYLIVDRPGTDSLYGDMGSRTLDDKEARVQHMWKGTWRHD